MTYDGQTECILVMAESKQIHSGLMFLVLSPLNWLLVFGTVLVQCVTWYNSRVYRDRFDWQTSLCKDWFLCLSFRYGEPSHNFSSAESSKIVNVSLSWNNFPDDYWRPKPFVVPIHMTHANLILVFHNTNDLFCITKTMPSITSHKKQWRFPISGITTVSTILSI